MLADRGSRFFYFWFGCICCFFGSSIWASDEILDLDPFVVEGSHELFSSSASELQLFSNEWDKARVLEMQPATLDDVLRLDPNFSFYRRQSGSFANPSTQDVSLRNIGATAASRSVVVLDGIPQNDPFGGWVSWARFPMLGLDSVSIQPASRASSWGQMSAGGVIQVQRSSINEKRLETYSFAGQANTISTEWLLQSPVGNHHGVSIGARSYESDGRFLVHPDDRGPLDGSAEIGQDRFDFRWTYESDARTGVQLNYSYFNEARNNGTPLAENSTLAKDFSLRVLQSYENGGLSFSVYRQEREFENTFTSVNAERTSENAVNHQFSIPGDAWGFKLTGFRELRVGWSTLFGLDGLQLQGETNEDTGWGLVNRRKAGGKQRILGLFVSNQMTSVVGHMLDVNFRLDRWDISEGFRNEFNKSSGITSKQERYEDRSSWEPGMSLAYQHAFSRELDVNIGLAKSFRLPTINELYRPFRVRNDITEANPSLDPEQFFSVESSLSWHPSQHWTAQLGVFEYWIENMVANVYQFDGPADSIGGFVPIGGTFSQKQNVRDSRVSGIQVKLDVSPLEAISLSLNYLYSDARFLENPNAAGVENRSFPQIPQHKWVCSASWEPISRLKIEGCWTYSSSQFDDALNTRELDAFNRLDAVVSYQLDLESNLTVFLNVNNLTNAVVLTGKSSNGIRSIAPERTIWVGVNWKFW